MNAPDSPDAATPESTAPASGFWSGALATVVIFAALNWSVILLAPHVSATSEAKDEARYHWPVIVTMMEQWPQVDLVDYQSSTAPGYHLLMAFVANVAGENLTLLRLVSSLGTLALLLLIWWRTRALGTCLGLAAFAPLFFSSYVLGASIWLTTDNWALALVAFVLGGAVLAAPTRGRLMGWGIASTGAVFIRQIHLWIAGVPWLALLACLPLMGGASRPLAPGAAPVTWRTVLLTSPFLLAPFALVAAFVIAWGGLTPPAFTAKHDAGVNPAALLLILTLIGGYGAFYWHAWGLRWSELLPRGRGAWLVIAAILLAGVVIPSGFDPKPGGRWGGFVWTIVDRLPEIKGRSLFLSVTAAFGGLVLWRIGQAARQRGAGPAAAILLLAMIGWALAQSTNSMAWQRYCEPMVLIGLALTTVLLNRGRPASRHAWIGPTILAVGLLGLSLLTLYRPAFLGP